VSRVRGIKFVSPYEASGYATAARRVLLGLRDAGVPFTWTPMVPGAGWDLSCEPFLGTAVGDPDLDPYCNRPLDYDTVVVQLVPEYLLHWRLREPHKRLVAMTVWETDSIPHHWRFFLEQADLVLVPCEWNRRVFEAADLRVPVGVLPHIVPKITPAAGPGRWAIPERDFVFYAIEVWTARKALDDLLRCYLDTFTAADPVTLVLKTGRYALTRVRRLGGYGSTACLVRALRRRYAHPARTVVITDTVPAEDIARLHARGDCYVSLTHGEGFGLGILDAAMYANAVITTGFGAPAEYLPADLAWLVNARLVPVVDDLGKPSCLRDQRWAEADPLHASALLRCAFDDRAEAARRGAGLRAAVAARFDERVVIARFLDLVGRAA
jgi:glycosyltransferase involved in cell wall biosynthesis